MKRRVLPVAALVALLAIGALWQPRAPDAIDLAQRFAALGGDHLLGTDHLGRDLLSRLMVAGWRTLAVILSVGAIGFVGGSALGTAAAVFGGTIEAVILRTAETFIVVPTLIVGLVAAAVFGLSPLSAGLALGLANLGPYALMSHTLTKATLREPYVHAARALGVGEGALMTRHVLPATLPILMTYVGSQAGGSAVAYASLSFIGLGADPSLPDWGSMLFEYRLFLFDHPSLVLWPGLALAATVAVLNLSFDREGEQLPQPS
jgi:peptide/nickel transport system permease protein